MKKGCLGRATFLVAGVLMAGCVGIEGAPLRGAPAANSADLGAGASAPAVRVADPIQPGSTDATPAPPSQRAVSPPPVTAQRPLPPSPPATPAPPLDLKSLETRLKETKAIGVFTKLALKNQLDDLVERFRALHQGRLKTSLKELRRSFDMLLLKTLALLQDTDPPLAGALASSRESLWRILSDPKKFAAI